MKKSSYTILMVFLLSMLVLVGFLGWYSMEHKKVTKHKSFREIDPLPSIEMNSNMQQEEIEKSYNIEVPKSTPTIEEKVEKISKTKPELIDTEDDNKDEPEEESQDIEEIMELGFSGEEAQKILDNEKGMKENPNLIMNFEINPEIIEKMESAGYTEEEAIKLLNKHMHNPDEMERIMEKLR